MESQTLSSRLLKKFDSIVGAVFLTPEGKPKSALMTYSFCLSVVFLAVYAFAYAYLIDVIERLTAPIFSVTARNLLESAVPGLAGSMLCCSLSFAPMDKRIVPCAYIWLCAYAVLTLVTMAFMCDLEEYAIFLYFFAMLAPAGLLSGVALSQAVYWRGRKRGKEKA